MFPLRSNALELIDLGQAFYTQEEYIDCLKKLGNIGKWLGGDLATFSALSKMPKKPLSILDVGCGGGHFTIKMAKKFPNAKVLGIDVNPDAIAFARQLACGVKNVSLEHRENPQMNEKPKSFDVVTTTLVCHHLKEKEIISFIQSACLIAKEKVIINDLQRSFIAYLLFKIISPICFRNRLVLHDGLLSIKRAFKRKDLIDYLKRAGIEKGQYCIRWHFPFRWIVEINCNG